MKIDIIGDIHGCFDEFYRLTVKLGYRWEDGLPKHPENRKLGFVGDLTDRGPESLKVVEVVWQLVINHNNAYYVPGNHCDKLYRFFKGNNVKIVHGLETTAAEYESLPKPKKQNISSKFRELYEKSPLYQVLDRGKLIIAHAGIREDFIGKANSKVKTFVLYGDIKGQTNPDGTPVRRDWAKNYMGEALIVYGHTPVKTARIVNNSYNIDTGAVFGGELTCLRYPERTLVSVPSTMPYIPEKFREIT